MSRLVTGNDFDLTVQLTRNGKPFIIDPGSIVVAALVGKDQNRLIAPVNSIRTTPGADWSRSKVVVRFVKQETANITAYGMADIEIGLTDLSGVLHPSWFVPVQIRKGNLN